MSHSEKGGILVMIKNKKPPISIIAAAYNMTRQNVYMIMKKHSIDWEYFLDPFLIKSILSNGKVLSNTSKILSDNKNINTICDFLERNGLTSVRSYENLEIVPNGFGDFLEKGFYRSFKKSEMSSYLNHARGLILSNIPEDQRAISKLNDLQKSRLKTIQSEYTKTNRRKAADQFFVMTAALGDLTKSTEKQ